MSFNQVILMGNLTADPEVREIANGNRVCDISLAVNEREKRSGGEYEETVSYFDCTLWNRDADVAGDYLCKGSQVLVEGKLRVESWEDGDGNKRRKYKVVVNNLRFAGGKRKETI